MYTAGTRPGIGLPAPCAVIVESVSLSQFISAPEEHLELYVANVAVQFFFVRATL